jgi:hypothetical protein
MFESTTTTKHSPAGVEDLPPAKVPWYTTSVEALSNYRLHVRFADGFAPSPIRQSLLA